MKKLVIFYSFEGNTKVIAENIALAVGADILELKPEKEQKPNGFLKYLWGGKQVLMRACPGLQPLDKDPRKYDLLFIGTPVWAGTYAPALRTFFSGQRFTTKKIALFCCHGGGKGTIFDKLKNALPDNQIVGEIDFQDPLKNNRAASVQRAKTWAQQLTKTIGQPG